MKSSTNHSKTNGSENKSIDEIMNSENDFYVLSDTDLINLLRGMEVNPTAKITHKDGANDTQRPTKAH